MRDINVYLNTGGFSSLVKESNVKSVNVYPSILLKWQASKWNPKSINYFEVSKMRYTIGDG
jgi:hypothetical protein